MKQNFTFVLLCVVCFSMYSQKERTVAVTLDLDQKRFSDEQAVKIPFDQKFYINGTTENKDVKYLSVKYKITDHFEYRDNNRGNRPENAQNAKQKITGDDSGAIVPQQDSLGNNAIVTKGDSTNLRGLRGWDDFEQTQPETGNKRQYRDADIDTVPKSFYRRNPKYYRKSRHYFLLDKGVDEEGYVHLEPVKVTNGKFSILMDALHPNEHYKIVFEFTENVNLGEEEEAKLRIEILTTIDKAYSYGQQMDNTRILEMIDEVSFRIRKATKGKPLYDSDDNLIDTGSVFSLNEDFKDLKSAVFNQNTKLDIIFKQIAENEDTPSGNILDELKGKKDVIKKGLELILKDDFFNKFLEESAYLPVNKEISNKQLLHFILFDYERSSLDRTAQDVEMIGELRINSYLLEVLAGRAKIKGYLIEATESFDTASIELLLSFFTRLQNLRDINDNLVFDPGYFDNINRYLFEWLSRVNEFKKEMEYLKSLKRRYFDIFKDIYSKWWVEVNESTFTNIDTKESPYIGIDFGVLVAPDISSTFLLEGVNFHLRPVNKNAKLSNLKHMDKFWKLTSFSFGIAQRVGSYDDTYENLLGAGSPYVGVGFRINRMIRLGGGALFYKRRNDNPVITDTVTKGTYFFSASVDIKLKDAISIIGKFL
ncbi:hypothetical protein V1387_10390 [Allomuricauda taeanensis]|uniref:hypothetical protein n=1 Tax=Flagellimonas taeanensis TaxID=1005926 RepID=UPI002E7BD9FE|nr:hypothetical protein [Allomuricauda taeanensis]MEE1963092.1 hypothetical protein [Allomuricauda taeanensis]